MVKPEDFDKRSKMKPRLHECGPYILSRLCWCDREHLYCEACGQPKAKKQRHGKRMSGS